MIIDLTLVAVGASEPFLTLAGKLAARLAPAAPVRAAHVRGDIPHPVGRTVGSHFHGAAVNHCEENKGLWVLGSLWANGM